MLSIHDLDVVFNAGHDEVHAVKGISYEVPSGSVVGVVGESGSGKSVSAMSVMGLLPHTARVSGRITWNNQDLLASSDQMMRQIRGREIGLIFQNPLSSLNPVFTIENQMVETIMLHHGVDAVEAKARAIELLHKVRIDQPEKRIFDFPHQFSLGMCQRIMIAMTLSMEPSLLIADEPTASLDVTTQKQILKLLHELKDELSMSMILISHDLGVVAEHCDHVVVMYLGTIVEQGSPEHIFTNPQHEYTKKLIDAIPKIHFRSAI